MKVKKNVSNWFFLNKRRGVRRKKKKAPTTKIRKQNTNKRTWKRAVVANYPRLGSKNTSDELGRSDASTDSITPHCRCCFVVVVVVFFASSRGPSISNGRNKMAARRIQLGHWMNSFHLLNQLFKHIAAGRTGLTVKTPRTRRRRRRGGGGGGRSVAR